MNMMQIGWWKGIIARVFSRGGEFRRNPKNSWNIVLSFLGIGIFVALVMGYITYIRSVEREEEAPSTIPRSSLRNTDVRSLIEMYQKKKEDMSVLLSDQPRFLSPGPGVGGAPREETLDLTATTSTSSVPRP